jgi:hypothetical protein
MPFDKAKHLPPKLANAFSKAKAKAKEKMVRKASVSQSDDSSAVADSRSTAQISADQTDPEVTREMYEMFSAEDSAEDKDDLEQMLKNDFATFNAEEYQAEIQPLFEELLTFMHRQDALDRLEGVL